MCLVSALDAEMEEFLEAADERLKDVMDTVAGSQCVQRLDTPSRGAQPDLL